jgi:serine phosphatase RsbU (regulator of sigma subunit)
MLILGVIILGFSQSTETTLALEEYNRIVDENKSYRSYGAESGLKGNVRFQFADEDGYRWYSSNDDGYKIYRFNGVRFDDVISVDPSASQDTMLPVLLKTKKTQQIYASGIHTLYLWQDYRWKKFAFPAQDFIQRMLIYEDDVYCIGEKGIGLFVKGVWTYRPLKTKISEADAQRADVSKSGNLYVAGKYIPRQKPQQSDATENSNKVIPAARELRLKKYAPGKTSTYMVASAAQYASGSNADKHGVLKTAFDYQNELMWIYEAGSDLLFKYDLKNDRSEQISLDEGAMVHSIVSTNSGKNWLITTTLGIVKADELNAGYPKTKGMQHSSYSEMYPRPDYLDFLYLEGQLLYLSTPLQGAEGIKYTAIRILEANKQSLYFHLKELVNPRKDSLCLQVYNYGDVLFLNFEHDKFQNVSHVVFAKYPFAQTKSRDILIDSAEYHLSYSKLMNLIINQRKGKITLIPLEIISEEIYQAPYHGQQMNYMTVSPVLYYKLLSFKGYGSQANTLFLHTLKAGKIRELAALENADLLGIDEDAELAYIKIRGTDSQDKLYTFPLNGGTQKLIASLDINDEFYLFPGGYHIFDGDLLKTNFTPTPAEAVALSGFNKTFMPALMADKISSGTGKAQGSKLNSQLLGAMDYLALDMQWMGSSLQKVTMIDGEISSSSDTELARIKISDLTKTPYITRDRETSIGIPTHIYNLLGDSILFKPMWIKFYPSRNMPPLVGHLEKLSKDGYRYRISEFHKGQLRLKENDFVYSLKNEYLPNVTAYLDDGKELFADSNQLFYRHDDAWETLDIKQFELYGKLESVSSLKGILWLCFDGAILRFDPQTKVKYAYAAEEGIPDKMESAFVEGGELMIKTSDKIYRFNEYENPLNLDIPYITVSDNVKISAASKIKLRYTQRRIHIPINILGPLYPDLCQVTYRLLGFNEDWITEDYQRNISYTKLPYGKFVFEAKVTAANGTQTPVQSISFRIRRPWYAAWYAIVIYILAGLGLIYLIYRWKLYSYREANLQLEHQVAERTHELQEWQKRMTQSIDYALLIQKSILPQEEQLRRLFKDYLLIWHPRDTVGGDFYWLSELSEGDSLLFAVIDCTGHGVPGALVSMTVNAALNHIVRDEGVNDPAEILQQLHQDIGFTLHQESERTQQDGLDISLVKIDYTAHTISFAGAVMNIVVYEPGNQELTILEGSKYSIGGLKHRKTHVFDPQQINYSPGSKLYMYSDGILDQTYEVDVRMKRLGPAQWYEKILEMGEKPLPEQKLLLEDMLKEMLLLDTQRDDITVVALQL